MKRAKVFVSGQEAGILSELEKGKRYQFSYGNGYGGSAVSLTMPVALGVFTFNEFPPFFDGLLPEGHQLEGLLKQAKVDRTDLFSQLMLVGHDTVGAVTIVEDKV
jgi:serine/threonine-protein kinase HipA